MKTTKVGWGRLKSLPLLGIVLMLWATVPARSQSLVFSQYYFAPAHLNPAFSGLEKDLMLGVNYRSQWRDLQIPYNAALFSASYPLIEAQPKPFQVGGVAFSVSQERAGTGGFYRSLRGQLSAAYNLRLDRQNQNIIAFGLQGGFVNNRIDDGNLQWGSQYSELIGYDPGVSPSMGFLNSKVIYPAFTAGFIWHHTQPKTYRREKYQGFLGMSFANLNRPNTAIFTESVSRAPVTYNIQGGIEYRLHKLQIAHHTLWIKADHAYHYNFGTYVTYNLLNHYNSSLNTLNLLVGSWYRLQDAFVLSMGLQAGKCNAALSYDFNKNSTGSSGLPGGAYEVSISYRIPRQVNHKQYGIPLM